DRLLALVTALIDVERAETGQLEVKRRIVKLGELLEGVARRHGKEAEARQITVRVDAAAELDAELDTDLISRVLENLIENATRYTNTGGTILISGRLDEGDAERIEIAVANTGTAIPPALRAKVFEKNVSGESKSARSTNLGLGLYFCRLAAR